VVTVAATGHRFRLVDPPDAAALVSTRISVSPYAWTAHVRVFTTAAALRLRVPPTVGVVEPDGDAAALLTFGADSLDLLLGHLVALAVPFEVLGPPELRARAGAVGRQLSTDHSPAP